MATPKPHPPPASCLPLKIKNVFLQVDGERGQVGINPSRTVGHLTAVAPGQSQRDTLSLAGSLLEMFLLFWGGYIELVLSFIWDLLYIFPPGQKCGEDLLSMTLCHDVVLASSQWRCTKAKCPSE